jgi:hypothetical protein
MVLRALVASLLLVIARSGPTTAQEENVAAVEPGGPGVLTKCRNWVLASSCRTYHHIRLPPRIAVGDSITVSFGSHPKQFRFLVARITLDGDHCTIFSEADQDKHVDNIMISSCKPAEVER